MRWNDVSSGSKVFIKNNITIYFPMSYSKRMPALIAAAAGNDITMWLSDFTGLLRFPRQGPFLIYDFVIRLCSGMLYCEKDKPMCQMKPGASSQNVVLLLTTSVWVRTYSAPDPSLSHIRVCVLRCQEAEPALMTVDLWRCFAYCTYGAGSQRSGEWRSASQSFAEFITPKGLDSASLYTEG